MSFNFGSSERRDRGAQTTTTTVQMPAASPEETELKKLNLELAKRQIAAMDRAEAEQAAAGGQPVSQLQQQVQQKALENIYARLTGQSPVLNPEEQARLDTVYNTAKTQGEQALTQYADQLAGVRGMRVSDTPIGGEVLRQRGNLELGLQGQKAASSLDLSQAGADFNARMAEFTGNLRQQAFMNQLALAGTTPASFGLQNQLFGERLGAAGRTQSGDFRGLTGMTGWNTGFDLSKAAGGAAMMYAGGCWIAAALYGWDTPDFTDARAWIMDHWQGPVAERVRTLYRRYGQRVAAFLTRHPWTKPLVRPFFAWAIRKERARG